MQKKTTIVKANGKHLYGLFHSKFFNKRLSQNRFIITGRGRSGSTALVSLLNSLPNVFCDGEILSGPMMYPKEHVLAKCKNSNSPIYGCKILSYQILKVQPIKNREDFIKHLHEEYNFKIIYLIRENLIYNALSVLRASEYGYHKKTSEKVGLKKFNVDPELLLKWMKISEMHNMFENICLNDVPHLSLTYEKHLANPENHYSTVKKVCDFLDIEYNENIKTEYQKVSPKTLKDSIANYEEVVDYLKNTKYSMYLEI